VRGRPFRRGKHRRFSAIVVAGQAHFSLGACVVSLKADRAHGRMDVYLIDDVPALLITCHSAAAAALRRALHDGPSARQTTAIRCRSSAIKAEMMPRSWDEDRTTQLRLGSRRRASSTPQTCHNYAIPFASRRRHLVGQVRRSTVSSSTSSRPSKVVCGTAPNKTRGMRRDGIWISKFRPQSFVYAKLPYNMATLFYAPLTDVNARYAETKTADEKFRSTTGDRRRLLNTNLSLLCLKLAHHHRRRLHIRRRCRPSIHHILSLNPPSTNDSRLLCCIHRWQHFLNRYTGWPKKVSHYD